MIITLAGPSAAGKGTLAKMLAERIGLPHYDFGIMFRFIAFMTDYFSFEYLLKSAHNGSIRYGETWIWIHDTLRTEEVGLIAARMACDHLSKMIVISQAMVRHRDFVCDGRTCGIEIYPKADYKFFVTAEQKTRIDRRDWDNKAVRRDREKIDRNRLVIPSGAITVNTTGKTREESLKEILLGITL